MIDKGFGREILVVAREPFLDETPQQCLVSGGSDLVVIRQARRVDISCARHAEGTRFLCHQLSEVALVTAEILSDDHGGVIRGFRDNGLDRILDRDGLSGLESELGWSLSGSVLGDL